MWISLLLGYFSEHFNLLRESGHAASVIRFPIFAFYRAKKLVYFLEFLTETKTTKKLGAQGLAKNTAIVFYNAGKA